jgi:hypothetical protein
MGGRRECMGTREVRTGVWVWKPEEMRLLLRFAHRLEGNIKMCLQENGWECMG